VSRTILGAAVALAGALCLAATIATAQSPAVNPKEAADAQTQQQRQVTQPLNNQPVWSEVRSGAPQVTTVKGRETNVLIQPEGQTWRALRVPILFWGGIIFALAVLGLAVFYLLRGTMGGEGRPGERVHGRHGNSGQPSAPGAPRRLCAAEAIPARQTPARFCRAS